MNDLHSIKMIGIIALVTIGLRFLPFFVFSGKKQTPAYMTYFGKVLPFSIMGMLVVYCLRSITFTAFPFGIPELLGCAVVALLHLWKRNTLLSIGVGTVFYMLLVQTVF